MSAPGRLELTLKYRPDLWEPATAERILADLVTALERVVAGGAAPVGPAGRTAGDRASSI
jgi:hypothetical protein